jgi:hypothetical protein
MKRIHRLAATLGSLGAVGAMVLTMAGAAGAATGPAATGPSVGSAGQSGYQIDHGQFRFAHGMLFARDGGLFHSTQAGIGGSISLIATSGLRLLLGASTGTSSHNEPWSPGVGVYQGKTLIAHQDDPAVHDSTTINGNTVPGDQLNTPDLQQLSYSIFYDRTHGNIKFEFVATASGDSYQGFYHAGTGLSFNRVRFATDFGNTPFDSLAYTAAPPAAKNYLTWTSAGLTSYSGHRGDLIDWWTRHTLVLVDAVGGSHPTGLFNSGTAFRTVLTP